MPGPLAIPFVLGAKKLLTLLLGAGAAYVASKLLSQSNPFKPKFKSNDYKPYNPPARPALKASQSTGLDLTPINAQMAKEYHNLVANGIPVTLTGISPFGQSNGKYWDYSTYAKDVLEYGPNTMPTLTVVEKLPHAPLMLNPTGQDLYRLQAAAKSGKLTAEDINIIQLIIEEKKKLLSQPEPPKKPKWYKDPRFWKGVGAGATAKAGYDLYQSYKNQPNESDSTYNVMYDPDAAKTYIENTPATEVPDVQPIDTTTVQPIGTTVSPTQNDYYDVLLNFMKNN